MVERVSYFKIIKIWWPSNLDVGGRTHLNDITEADKIKYQTPLDELNAQEYLSQIITNKGEPE